MIVFAAALLTSITFQSGDFNYVKVEGKPFNFEIREIPDMWLLSPFEFRSPRYIDTDIPGKGRTRLLYFTYKIMNTTGKDRTFMPKFTLVTDTNKTYDDVIMPTAKMSVRMKENPIAPLFDSVDIAKKPIPNTEADQKPAVVYGVAFFEGVDPEADGFSIYVTGLSNAYQKVKDEENGTEDIRVKTLKLNFKRPGDSIDQQYYEIRYLDSEWIYR